MRTGIALTLPEVTQLTCQPSKLSCHSLKFLARSSRIMQSLVPIVYSFFIGILNTAELENRERISTLEHIVSDGRAEALVISGTTF